VEVVGVIKRFTVAQSYAWLWLLPIGLPLPLDQRALWFDLGHRMVARIAEQRLKPHTAEAVRDILDGQSLADASVWADNIKQYRHDADALHYVDIPLTASAYDSARDCPHGKCLIAAIASDQQVLANPSASRLDRADALRFLIHFMGDLHQPLHVADNADRGGNRRAVFLDGDSTNLHAAWDGKILEHYRLTEDTYLGELRREMDTIPLAALERGTIVDWAMEGHRLAVRHAYRLRRDGRLDQRYLEANRPIIDRAIIAAGVRLARVLNEALAGYRPTAPATVSLGPGVYTDREAIAHVGETAAVVGTVAAVFRSPGGNVYVNFGADYPRQTFTAVALAPLGSWTARLDSLTGKRVRVRGEIVKYRGRVEIVLNEPGQISVEPGAP
jgi:nuclease S1